MLVQLALRQGLLALSVAAGVLFLLIAVLIARSVVAPEFMPGSAYFGAPADPGNVLRLASVKDRATYDAITARKLFGAAGAYEPGAKPTETLPPPTETAEETSLPLVLNGTSLSQGSDPRAAAIIDVREGGIGTKTFYPGDEITTDVTLKEVRPASVLIDNRRNNRIELLQFDWNSNSQPNTLAAIRSRTSPMAAAAINRPNLITLNREEITKKVEEEYARVASSLNVKVVTGDDGQVQGITTDNIEQYDVARELGFQNGDVLVSVNNEPVKSREDAVNVVQKYKSASIFRIGVLRGGQMQYITYRVR